MAALQGCGYVCAVTGNGPGDVAAMRTAAIGVVLEGGARGGRRIAGVTDVARGAAGLVLREGDLAALASCLEGARRLLWGTRAAVMHTVACHLTLALLWPLLMSVSAARAAALHLKGPAAVGALPLSAAQLLVLEALRMAGVGLGLPEAVQEGEDDDEEEDFDGGGGRMQPQQRAVRFVGGSIAGNSPVGRALVSTVGLVAAVGVAALYAGVQHEASRLSTVAFGTLLLAQPLLALTLRSARRPCSSSIGPPLLSFEGGGERVLWLWLLAAALLLGLCAVSPGTQRAMGLVPLPARVWGGVVLSAVVFTCWGEPCKCLGLRWWGPRRKRVALPSSSSLQQQQGYGSIGSGRSERAAVGGVEAAGQGERTRLLG